jgi:hypothetical protein
MAPTTFASVSGNAALTKFECFVANAPFLTLGSAIYSQTYSPAVATASVEFTVSALTLSTQSVPVYLTFVFTSTDPLARFTQSSAMMITFVHQSSDASTLTTEYPEVLFTLNCNGATGAAVNASAPRYVYNAQNALVATLTNPNSGIVQLRDNSYAWASFFAATNNTTPASTSSGYNGSNNCAVSPQGTVVVYDRYWNNTFGTVWNSDGSVAATLPAPAAGTCLVAKYLMNGRLHWVASVTGNTVDADFPAGSATNESGGVYAFGTHATNGATNLIVYDPSGNATIVDSINSNRGNNGYVIYFTPSGTVETSATFNTTQYDQVVSVVADDSNGCVYALGTTNTSVDMLYKLFYETGTTLVDIVDESLFLARMKRSAGSTSATWFNLVVIYGIVGDTASIAIQPGTNNVYALSYAYEKFQLATVSGPRSIVLGDDLICLFKWNGSGVFLYSVIFKTTGTVTSAICKETANGVFVVAQVNSAMTVYAATDNVLSSIPAVQATVSTSAGSPVAVVKCSHEGVVDWSRLFTCTGNIVVQNMYTLMSDSVYVNLFFTGQMTFSGNSTTPTTVGKSLSSRCTALVRVNDDGGMDLIGYIDTF